jgi:transposase InsO family protein
MREDHLREEPSASEGGRRPTGDADRTEIPARPEEGGTPTPGAGTEGVREPGGAPRPEEAPPDLDHLPRLGPPRKGRRLVKKEEGRGESLTPEQRLLLLDTWQRSGLSARDFAALVGLSRHTLYGWKKKFSRYGPEGLLDRARGGPRGSRLPELTRRAILLIKKEHPDWGCRRISDMLLRGPALPASPSAVLRVLKDAGYVLDEVVTRPHPPRTVRFERSKANELWQTDIFTFTLKRQNRRVYLVVFLDDYSRYIVGWGLQPSPSAAWVIDVFRSAVASFGPPDEVLTDNGPQYVTWRGKSAFSKELERRKVRHVVARPRRPQTLGKVERFWGSLWRECLETALFGDIADATVRVGHYIDHHNLQRPHQGIDGLVPADRYFGAASEVRRALEERVAENAIDLARDGVPKEPFYLTGKVGGKGFSVHAHGERVILLPEEGGRREIELVGPGAVGPRDGSVSKDREDADGRGDDAEGRGETVAGKEEGQGRDEDGPEEKGTPAHRGQS